MRVLHVSGADVSGGGAARATYRLHTGLREAGVDSRVLVGYDDTSDPTVDGTSGVRGRLGQAARRRINKLSLYRYPELFSPAWAPERRTEPIRADKYTNPRKTLRSPHFVLQVLLSVSQRLQLILYRFF